jgi:hypothetical protein
MSVRITTNQNTVTVADADKSITIINNREPNRIDIVQPESNVIYVAALGPQGATGPQGPEGSGGGGTTDISALNSFSGSILLFTQSIQTQVSGLSNATSSYVLASITSSMLQPYVLTSTTSSMIVSGALTASHYRETDPIFVAKSGSLATTGSNAFRGNQIITGSVYLKSGSVIDSIGADIYIKAGVGVNAGVALYNNNSTQYLAVDDTGSYANKFTAAVSVTSPSFTGSLQGTGSWALNAVTASYILSSNVSGPNGFDSVNYASSAGSADAVADPLTQDLQIRGLLSTRIMLTDLQGLLADLYTNAGNVVEGAVGTSVDRGNLCYLDFNTPAWELVDQGNNNSTNLLAVCVEATTGYFLLDGKITLDSTFIGGTLRQGYPVYLSGSGLFTTDVSTLTTGYVRIVGHLLDTDGEGNWLLNFRPDHTWIEL